VIDAIRGEGAKGLSFPERSSGAAFSQQSEDTDGLEPLGDDGCYSEFVPRAPLAANEALIAGTERSDLGRVAGSRYPQSIPELENPQILSVGDNPVQGIDRRLRVACQADFNHPHRGSYIPISSLKSIMNPEAVASVLSFSDITLSETSENETLQVAKHILGHDNESCYLKVLAILIMIGKVGEFADFYHEGIDDSKLPLQHQGSIKDPSFCLKNNAHPVKCFKHWDSNSREQFNERQWEMLAQTFFDSKPGDRGKKVPHFKISHRRPLPFTRVSGIKYDTLKRGQFADVTPFTIHDAHHNFPSFSVRQVSIMLIFCVENVLISHSPKDTRHYLPLSGSKIWIGMTHFKMK